MGTYVGKWDCPACGTVRIPGWENGRTVESCPSCGSPCTKKWYLDDRSMVISSPEEIAKAKSKRAWTCGHCQHVNDADDLECDSCGNARDIASGDEQVVARTYSPDDVPKTADEVADIKEEEVGKKGTEAEKVRTKSGEIEFQKQLAAKKRRRNKIIGIVAGIAAFAVLAVFLLSWRSEVMVEVSGFAWNRTLDIEDYAPRSKSTWDYPPSAAYSITSQQEIHHYNSVFDHTECHNESYTYVCGTTDNGNGTFSDQYCSDSKEVCNDVYRDEPVYATKYYYKIDEWAFHHTEKAEKPDKNPFWPKDPKTISQPRSWREGDKTETYYLLIRDHKGKPQKEKVSPKLWNEKKKGAKVKAYKNRIFGFWMGLAEH